MALKQLELHEQINNSKNYLEEINTELAQIEERSQKFKDEFNKASEKNDALKMQSLLDEDTELSQRKIELETKRDQTESLLELLNNSLEDVMKGNTTQMELKAQNNEQLDVRSMFNNYIRTRDISDLKENGMVTEDGEAIIPQDTVTNPTEQPYTIQDLLSYVNTETTNTSSGTWPVIDTTRAELAEVGELDKNPDLVKIPFRNIDYKIKTYRGRLPLSQELIDDAGFDLVGYVLKHLARIKLNTTNHLVLNTLKLFETKEVTLIDDIKKLLNVNLDPSYNKCIYLSQSLFHAISILKDNNGRDLMQPDLTQSAQLKLFGYPIIIVRDDLIGEETGDMVGFVGDSDAGVNFFDRMQISAQWIPHDVYGQVFMVGFRGDIQKVNDEAGFYIKWKEPTKSQLSDPSLKGQLIIADK